MNIPFRIYHSLIDFDKNYIEDLASYRNLITEANEIDYVNFLLEKYRDWQHSLNRMTNKFIALRSKNIKPEEFNMPRDIKYQDLNNFATRAEAIKAFRRVTGQAEIAYLNEIEYRFLINHFFDANYDGLAFNEVKYENHKKAILRIEEYLVKKKIMISKNKKTSNSIIEPLDFDLNQSEVIYLFDILIEANFLKVPKAQDGSYWRKLETYFTASGKPIKNAEQIKFKYKDNKGAPSTAESIKHKLRHALTKM